MMEIKVVANIMDANDQIASQNRRRFQGLGLKVVNMLSSPGAGKTTLLEKTFQEIGDRVRFGVIEGDVQTSRDAERVQVYGVPVVQINTGGGCHLDANMVQSSFPELKLEGAQILFIENVGNLICPSAYDLGEDRTVVLLSVSEGDDKPLKYPAVFRKADLLVINKVDLVPYTDFNVRRAAEFARRINPALPVLEVSCRTGEGLESWFSWLQDLLKA
jgi:hydrogenase nickel incorporation protein HypB